MINRSLLFVMGRLSAHLQRLQNVVGRRSSCESGQAMTEYIFLIVLVALVCIPVVELLPQAVLGYVRPFYYCISRPVP